MEIRDWITIAIGLILSLISYVWKREMDVLKGENDELKSMVKEREERNYDSHKEIFEKLALLSERVSKIESVQEHCKGCNNVS